MVIEHTDSTARRGRKDATMTKPAHKMADDQMRRWMRSELSMGHHIDPLTGEAGATELAEAAANHFDCHHRLDDDQDTIWDEAVQAVCWFEHR